jgi:hypothetical protein
MGNTARLVIALFFSIGIAGSVGAQFLETFDDPELSIDPSGVEGWSFFSGDGEATIELVATEEGHASILVDATRDRRNVWWALIKRRVSEQMDLERLVRPGWELRVEARIRTSHAPRRVNLHLNTQRTTDFQNHLMEFDIPEAGKWRTISMTSRDFPGKPGDTIFAQMALMDWGIGTYRIDVDYFKVDLVNTDRVGADLGEPLPYHPPIPDLETFGHELPAAENAVVDLSHPNVKIGERLAQENADRPKLLTVGGSKWVILRWDVNAYWGRLVTGHGLLELTTHSLTRSADEREDSELVRVVEILAGDPEWRRETVTLDNVTRGQALDEVFSPQMIIDWPVAEGSGTKTWFTISRPVLQRLIEGRTLGLAIRPLGSINASFYAENGNAPRLLFNVQE